MLVLVLVVVVVVVVSRICVIHKCRTRDEWHLLAGERLADGRDVVNLAVDRVERRRQGIRHDGHGVLVVLGHNVR
jgi:hypothetical protein